MTNPEIIAFFFEHGCVNPEGEKLPLRNCEHIHKLYKDELKSKLCIACEERNVKKKYEYRLNYFLKREAKKLNTGFRGSAQDSGYIR
jgi:hypothetical protein